MEIGVDIEKVRDSLSCKNLKKCFFDFLFFKSRLLVLFLMLIIFGFSIYIWYFKVYSPAWSESRKQEYIRTKEQTVTFNKVGFQNLISEFDSRINKKQKETGDPPDIFRLKK